MLSLVGLSWKQHCCAVTGGYPCVLLCKYIRQVTYYRQVIPKRNSATVPGMVREISSGGVVVRRMSGVWMMAAIEPQREENKQPSRTRRAVLALPKGLVDPGEKPDQTALREVREETGISGKIIAKLTDIKYVYVRSWGDGERVFKIVSFYLLGYMGGEIDNLTEAMRVEVKRALWIPLADATKSLAYSSEKKVARMAEEYVSAHPALEDVQA